MRYPFGLLCVLALGVMPLVGCSETAGTAGRGGSAGAGGSGGDGGSAGNGLSPCYAQSGAGGFGGGAGPVEPGLWLGGFPDSNVDGNEFDSGYAICFYVNDDCTALMATTECDIDRDDDEAHFLEIQWKDDAGINQTGGECSAGVGVTPDMVTEVPLNEFHRFTIEFTDDDGGKWSITGDLGYGSVGTAVGTARRTSGSMYCEIDPEFDLPGDGWVAFPN